MIKTTIRSIMDEKGLTVQTLAQQSGLSYGAILGLYRGVSERMELKTIEMLCKALKCTPNDLFEITDEIKK